MGDQTGSYESLALAELLDRALYKGVVLWGDATISVAGVDLIYLGLKLILASTDTARAQAATATAERNS
ncbi:MAG: gas vesicle protein [Beijerinckiaceae bacterium]